VCVVTVRRLNRYEVIQIRRLGSIENFVREMILSFKNFKPVARTHAHTHARARARTRTHTHTHTHNSVVMD